MEVIVLTMGGRELKIELESSDTVKELKEKIYQQYKDIPISNQKLIFNAQILDNDSAYLRNFLHQGARLQLHPIPFAGNQPPNPHDHLLDDQKIQHRPFSTPSHHQDQYQRINPRPILPLSQDQPASSSSSAAEAASELMPLPSSSCREKVITEKLNLSFESLDKNVRHIEVNSSATIRELKERIQQEFFPTFDASSLKLFILGFLMEDDHVTRVYGLKNGSHLQLRFDNELVPSHFNLDQDEIGKIYEFFKIDGSSLTSSSTSTQDHILDYSLPPPSLSNRLPLSSSSSRLTKIRMVVTVPSYIIESQKLNIEMDSCDTVGQLKKKISDFGRIAVERICLKFSGNELDDDIRKLSDYGLSAATPNNNVKVYVLELFDRKGTPSEAA